MYLKKNNLVDLINSLSTAETRYFYQYLKSLNHTEVPGYLNLFKQQKSDLPQWPERSSPQAFTKAKSRLYKHLIKSLRQYHINKSIEVNIQNLLCEIEILYDRGLPEQSFILLKKAHSKALANENFGLALQTLSWERKLGIAMDRPARTNKQIAEEEKMILKKLNQIIELEYIYGRAKEFKKKYGYVKGTVKQELEKVTIKSPYFKKGFKPDSQRSKYYYHFIHSLYYVMIFDTKRAHRHSRELLSPEIQEVLSNEYLEGILEHVTSCLGLGYFEEMQTGLSAADTFVQQNRFDHSTSLLTRVFYFQTCYTLIMYIYMGNITQLTDFIRHTEEKVNHYKKQLSTEMKLVIYGNLRNAYIASGAHEKAGVMLETLLYKESKHVRGDVYNDLFLSRVFSFLASGTYVLVPVMALSANRQYKQSQNDDRQLEVGLKITSILMKNYDYEDPVIRESVLLHVKEILVGHIASLKGLNNFQEIYSFYLIWTNSMLYGQPFYEAAAEWYQNHLNTLASVKSSYE